MTAAPTVFAGDGEPCRNCGAPLAADQRYCLACGARRAGAHLPFLEALRDPAPMELRALSPVGGAIPSPAADATLLGRVRANTAVIAGVGVLLLAMLIGVLLGTAGRDTTTTAVGSQKPVVITVGGGAAAAPAAAATEGATSSASGGAAKAKHHAAASSTTAVKPKAASTQTLKSLDKLSGKAYQKQIDKLGKNIAVGGKAPPKDNKAPAAGGSFQDIG